MHGIVEFIAVTGSAGGAMEAREQVAAVAGQGLEGDRYAAGAGYYSATPSPGGGRALTLFEAETRRNVTTRGIHLDDLIGRRFRVGEVLCEGVRHCEPCVRLEGLTGKPVLKPLVDRGGLRANIFTGGVIRLGDAVTVET